jgi:hypothetical protein
VPDAAKIAGAPGGGPNPAADGLLAELRAAGSGAPSLRVGGSSADQAWWNPRGRPRPAGIHFDLTRAHLEQLRRFRARTGSPLILGLNLVNRRADTATGYAAAARRVLGPRGVRAYELGNEPDAYAALPYYTTRAGRVVNERPPGYAFPDFLREWSARAALLRARAGPLPLAGPSPCCARPYLDGLGTFVARERSRLAAVSVHEYFGSACAHKAPGAPPPSRAQLLGEPAMDRVVGQLATAAATARSAGKPLLVTETNSFACGGQPGISDTFTASLWAPEYLMRAAMAGVGGMDFHTFGRAYSPFRFTRPNGRWRGLAEPLYYGMLLFARATAGRAWILQDPLDTQRVRAGANAVAFPTQDAAGTLRVMVLAKGGPRGGQVRIAVPGGASRARLTRLTAAGLGARTGITLGGRAVPAGSETGRLEGPTRQATVRRRGDGYTFPMPAVGAALLEVEAPR